MLASAGTVFNAMATGLFWIVVGIIILIGLFLYGLFRLERYRTERDAIRDRGRPSNTAVKELIKQGKLGPGGFPIRKRRGKK